MNQGFTLIEVLVALAIVAIALGAAIRAVGVATDTSQALQERLLANWLAENRLALHQARRDWPNPGEYSGEADYGGLRFHWQELVSTTDNAYFKRLQIRVRLAGQTQDNLAELNGYLSAQ